MSLESFCMLTPLRFIRLSTSRGIPADSGTPQTSAMTWTEIRQADIQLDIYGKHAGDRALALETLFASVYGYERIKALDERLAPLYTSAALQTSMINDFSITANVVTSAGAALDANGLMLTDNQLIPAGHVQTFGSAQEVADLLGAQSKEYQAASLYFSGYDNATVLPASLRMTRLVLQDSPGWLLSGSLKGVSLAAIKGLTGTLKLTIDGNVVTSTSVDFSTANTLSDIATALQAAIGSTVTVAWLAQANRFIVRTATTGEGSTVSFAEPGTVATGLKLTQNTAATLSPGSNEQPPADTMNGVVNQDQDWIGFMSLADLTDEQKQSLCAW
uniref:Phage neck terminator protein gp12-like domain-containing protein n=1 Tax=Glossina brevipalpis TaxID=37001 RepID=A0A1A9VZ92_9MUSC